MKFYYIGLGLKILLLAAAVGGVFFGLQAIGLRIFDAPEAPAAAAPRNILLALMESYEKTLLANRAALEKQRTVILDLLKAAATRAERAKIQGDLTALDRQYAANESALVSAVGERKTLEAREKEAADRLRRLSEAELRSSDELLQLKTYWNGYTLTLKNELLGLAADEADRKTIMEAFTADNGLSYLTAVSREYRAQGRELAALKGDTSAKDNLDKTLTDKANLESDVDALQKRAKTLEAELSAKKNEAAEKDAQIRTLFGISQVYGFFITLGGRTQAVYNTNSLPEASITGHFTVYDRDKKAVSKIYVSKVNNRLTYTKYAGMAEPKPGDWWGAAPK